MKTVAGLRSGFEERRPGERFADHVLVAGLRGVIDRGYDLVHVIASTTPFTDEERARFLARCRELEFIAFHPADGASAGNLYERIAKADSLAALDATMPFSLGRRRTIARSSTPSAGARWRARSARWRRTRSSRPASPSARSPSCSASDPSCGARGRPDPICAGGGACSDSSPASGAATC